MVKFEHETMKGYQNMALYEHVFMARQDASVAQVEALIEQFKAVITAGGGTVGIWDAGADGGLVGGAGGHSDDPAAVRARFGRGAGADLQ